MTALLPDDTTEEKEKKGKVYTEEEQNKSIVRWDTLAKDDKTLYEGNLLYMGVVGKMNRDDKDFERVLDKYVEVVGYYEARAFIQNLSRVEFIKPNVDVNTKGGEAVAKVDLLRQLWINQVFGEFETDDTTSFIKTLPNNDINLRISSTRQRVADIRNEIAVIPDGPHKSEKRVQLTDLTDILIDLEEQREVSKTLPSVNYQIPPDETLSYSDTNIISFAGTILKGEQTPKTNNDKRWLSLNGLTYNITLEELQAYAFAVDSASTDVSQIVEEARLKAGEARSLGITPDTGVGLPQELVSQIDGINDKIGQLKGKRKAATEVLVDAARYIVAAELGVINVSGLEGPNQLLNKDTKEIGPGIPEVTSKALDKEIAQYEKERSFAVEKLSKIENTLENRWKIGAVEHHISMIDFHMNSRKSLKKLGSITTDLTTKVPIARDTLTVKQKEENTRKLVDGTKAIEAMDTAINKMKDQMTSQIGKVIIPVANSDIMYSISYALHELDAAKDTVTSKFIENIASTLPLEFEDTLENAQILQDRKATQYAASAILSMIEELGILKQDGPKYFKDYYKVRVANSKFVTAFQSGINEVSEKPDGKIARRLKKGKKAAHQLSFTGIPLWTKFKHKSGLKAVRKISPTEIKAMNETPKVFNILNRASGVWMSTNDELSNIVEHMVNIEHPALTFQNKNYSADARASKLRERDAVRSTARVAAGKKFQYNYVFGSRGRLYASSAFFNQQASKHAKATIRLATKKPMGNDGWGWLLADLGESFGAKVNSLDDLQSFAFENLNTWIKWVQNPVKYADELFGDSNGKGGVDEPMLFIDAVIEAKNALAHGNPATYPSNYSSYIDASVSGVQVLGGLLGSSEELAYVNMMPGVKKQDLYAIVYNELVKNGTIILNPDEDQLRIYKEIQDTLDEFDQEKRDSYEDKGSVLVQRPRSVKSMTPKEYINHKKGVFKDEMKEKGLWNIYNGVYWGQKHMVDAGRKASKGPVMTKNYDSVVSGMSEALMELFGVEKDITITRDNTYWLAEKLDEGADKKLPRIKALREVLKIIAKNKITKEDPDFGFVGQSGFPYKRRYREVETYNLAHKYRGDINTNLDESLHDE